MYTTQADILERIPEETLTQLTDDDNVGTIDADKVTAAIARAGQEIDAYCGGRYSVPFATAPAVIGGLATDMAIYFLYGRTQEEIPETRKDAYKNAVRLLEKIADGKISLGVDPTPAAPSGSGASFSGGARRFNRDTLKGM